MEIKVIKEKEVDIFKLPEKERDILIERWITGESVLDRTAVKATVDEHVAYLTQDIVPTITEILLEKLLELPCVKPHVILDRGETPPPHITINNVIIIGLTILPRPWASTAYKTYKLSDVIDIGDFSPTKLFLDNVGAPFCYWPTEALEVKFADVHKDVAYWYAQMMNAIRTSRSVSDVVYQFVNEAAKKVIDSEVIGALTTSLPDKIPPKQAKLNEAFQKIFRGKFTTYFRLSIISDLIRDSLWDDYYASYVDSKMQKKTIDKILAKQAGEDMMRKAIFEHEGKYLAEIVYRQIYLQHFGELPVLSNTSIISVVSPEVKKYLLKEKKVQDDYQTEILNNDCPHVSMYFKWRSTDNPEHLNQLRTFFGNMGDFISCNNCGFNIMCSHLLADEIGLKSFLDKNPINNWYFCNVCNEQIMPSEDSEFVSYSDRMLYNNKQDVVASFLWKQIMYTLRSLVWSTPKDDNDFKKLANQFTNALYQPAKDVYDGLVKRKADTIAMVEAKRRLYTGMYIFAFLLKMVNEHPNKVDFRAPDELPTEDRSRKRNDKHNGKRTDFQISVDNAITLFERIHYKDMLMDNKTIKTVESMILKIYEKVGTDDTQKAELEEKSKLTTDLMKILTNPAYNYAFVINTVDCMLNGKKPPQYEDVKFLLNLAPKDVFKGTFKHIRVPDFSKWPKLLGTDKKLEPTIGLLEEYAQAKYVNIVIKAYKRYVEYINKKSAPPIELGDDNAFYYINQLSNKGFIRQPPMMLPSMQFVRYPVDVILVDYEKGNFFNYYFLRCPEGEFHEWSDDSTCVKCKGTRSQIKLEDVAYYKKYKKTYDKVMEIKTKTETDALRTKFDAIVAAPVIPTQIDASEEQIKSAASTIASKYFDAYKVARGVSWSKSQFINSLLYMGTSEGNLYHSVLEGTAVLMKGFTRLYRLLSHLDFIAITANLLINRLTIADLPEYLSEVKSQPDAIEMPKNATENGVLFIIIDYISKQPSDVALLLLQELLHRDMELAKPTLADMALYKAFFERRNDLVVGDDRDSLETAEDKPTFYDFDYEQDARNDADADVAEIQFG